MIDSNYFCVFSLPRKLGLDTAALEKAYYAQSRKLHPDRFAAKPVAEQETALAEASRLNDAYRTLKDPIARTEYLLTLEGVQLDEQSKQATDAAKTAGIAKKQIAPPELLEEVFELNMQLEEMRMNRKMGEDDPQLAKELQVAKANFEGMLAVTQTELEALWTKWDAGVDADDASAKDSAKKELVALLNRRSYVRNLVRDVNEALE
ncbi:MAG: Fe-S protein assembly co-chaperone HscB [Acidobacteriaceae bacterium]|nr:Fe-S protein assembly co-chaperone HscB [Acidobacteriaceae bacterium]